MNKPRTTMDVKKMRIIGQDILKEPRRFNMSFWLTRVTNASCARDIGHSERRIPPCGTVACFAGHYAFRYLEMNPADCCGMTVSGHVSDLCARGLNLPNRRLLHECQWPGDLVMRSKPGTKAYARYFVETVLENYIATNGWDGIW